MDKNVWRRSALSQRKESDRATVTWVSEVTGAYKWYIAALAVIESILGLMGVGYALLFSRLVDSATNADRDGFFHAVWLMLSLILIQLLFRSLDRYVLELASAQISNRFRMRLFSKLLYKDYAQVAATHSGEWMNRLTSDVSVVTNGVTDIVPTAFGMGVKLISAVAALVVLMPGLSAALIPGCLLLVWLTIRLRPFLKSLFKKIQEADGKVRILMQERLESMLVIRAFSQEARAIEDAKEKMEFHKRARMHRNKYSILYVGGFSVAMNLAMVLGAIVCGYGILKGTVTFGTFTAVQKLIGQVQSPFANISSLLPQYFTALASAERLMIAERFPDADAPDEEGDEQEHRATPDRFESIGLDHVSFTYQPPTDDSKAAETVMPVVLRDFSLQVHSGEYVAFIGPSGCGKSTVMKLMMCLYPLDSGRRYIVTEDGRKPLKQYSHGLFAYVPQGNQLISGSIREIVAFHDPERMKDDAAIARALEVACAKGFVDELKDGIDTRLGEHGAGLSEGQMQRIALARAVFSDHPILMLDEATSSLDEKTEAQLLKNLRSMTDKTVIIVTHRMSVLEITDKTIDFGQMGKQDTEVTA